MLKKQRGGKGIIVGIGICCIKAAFFSVGTGLHNFVIPACFGQSIPNCFAKCLLSCAKTPFPTGKMPPFFRKLYCLYCPFLFDMLGLFSDFCWFYHYEKRGGWEKSKNCWGQGIWFWLGLNLLWRFGSQIFLCVVSIWFDF